MNFNGLIRKAQESYSIGVINDAQFRRIMHFLDLKIQPIEYINEFCELLSCQPKDIMTMNMDKGLYDDIF